MNDRLNVKLRSEQIIYALMFSLLMCGFADNFHWGIENSESDYGFSTSATENDRYGLTIPQKLRRFRI
jgi:hypothetical protein